MSENRKKLTESVFNNFYITHEHGVDLFNMDLQDAIDAELSLHELNCNASVEKLKHELDKLILEKEDITNKYNALAELANN